MSPRDDHEAALYYGEFGILDAEPDEPIEDGWWDSIEDQDRRYESEHGRE